MFVSIGFPFQIMGKRKQTQPTLETIVEVVLDTFFPNEDPVILELLRGMGNAISDFPHKDELASVTGIIKHMESAVSQRKLLKVYFAYFDKFLESHPNFIFDSAVEAKIKKFDTALESECITIMPVSDADKLTLLIAKKSSLEEFFAIEQDEGFEGFMSYLIKHLDVLIQRYSRKLKDIANIPTNATPESSKELHHLWVYSEAQLKELSAQLYDNGFTGNPLDFYTIFVNDNFKCKWALRPTAAYLFAKLLPDAEPITYLPFIIRKLSFAQGEPSLPRMQTHYGQITYMLDMEKQFLRGKYQTLSIIVKKVLKR